MATFDELGIPFPLFEAPTTEASNFAGVATCRLCGARDRNCFELGIGSTLIVPCPTCGVDNGLDASGRSDVSCRSCGSGVAFPTALKAKKQLLACYECLRAGKAALTKDTEFGMVSWNQALRGITHGAPGLRTSEFELVPIDPEEDWYGVRVPAEHLWELIRTPGFHSWQDERWLFCCREPMAYVGGWAAASKARPPSSDERAFFETLVEPGEPSREWIWEGLASGNVCLYVYRCRRCDGFRSTWDTD